MRRPSAWLLPALLAAGQIAVWPGVPLLRGDELSPAAAVTVAGVAVVVAAALLWRRRAPVATQVAVVLAITAGMWGPPEDALVVIGFADPIALFSVAVHRSRRVALTAAGATLVWQAGLLALTGGPFAEEVGAVAGIYLVVVAAGRRRARWHAERAAAAARLADAEARRARAADDERHRLARELHDVTAHHLTAIVVSVSAAQRLASVRPAAAAEALAFAARTGRETLAALHRLVALIGVPAAPPDLTALVAGARAAGRQVTLELPAGGLPPEIAAVAAAVAREALTNAARYAPGSAVRIAVERDGAEVRMTVDDGDAPAGLVPVTGLGGGRGIAGMRERAAALGGALTAGPRPGGGGWRVQAVLPLPGRPERPAADRPWSGHVIDALLIGVALLGPAAALFELRNDPGLPAPGQSALVALAAAAHALPLWWRRRRPWTVLAAVVVTAWSWPLFVATGLLPPDAGWLAPAGVGADLLAVHAVGRYGRRPVRDWVAMPVGVAAPALASGAARALTPPPDGTPHQSFVPMAAVSVILMGILLLLPVAGAWLVGFVVRRRRERVAGREENAVAVAAYQAWVTAGAERARVAAGLRAAVPRHAEAMVAAADAGDVDAVLDEARAALTAMRELVGGLRDGPAVERAPQPTLASVAALADRWRAHGRDVAVHLGDAGRDLPVDVDVSAYRVVELMLAAGTGPVTVRVDAGADPVRIAVTPAPGDPDGEVAAGLRARAAAVKGVVLATPGGLEVRLPAGIGEVASSPSG
jgi:signal transduction histidine kinase